MSKVKDDPPPLHRGSTSSRSSHEVPGISASTTDDLLRQRRTSKSLMIAQTSETSKNIPGPDPIPEYQKELFSDIELLSISSKLSNRIQPPKSANQQSMGYRPRYSSEASKGKKMDEIHFEEETEFLSATNKFSTTTVYVSGTSSITLHTCCFVYKNHAGITKYIGCSYVLGILLLPSGSINLFEKLKPKMRPKQN